MPIHALLRIFVALSTAAVLTACGKPATPPAPPLSSVTVVTLKTAPLTLTRELPGRTTPFLVAEVRPQVTGLVTGRLFTEGGLVKAGDALCEAAGLPTHWDVLEESSFIATNGAKAAP